MTPADPRDQIPSDDADRTAPLASSSSRDRQILDNYLLRELIGAGGMGEVYRAEQTRPIQRIVAIKVIKRGMDTKEVIARFEAERQALALMDHPCISKVFDAGSTSTGSPYFVMEYVRGIPITSYCDKQNLPIRARLELFMQLCEGVQHAHQKAIIHRDLKPTNVLVTIQEDKPVPKIIDFGVAKATAKKLTEKTMYTALGELMGTPEYMSPEQAEMTGEDVDTRTDVYSLGVILYELLAGALPFEPTELRKAGFGGIVRMIREQDPARPSTKVSSLGERTTDIARSRHTLPDKLRSRLRGDLDWVTMKALEKDRTRRYGSAAELAADLHRHLNHEPVSAGPPSATYRAGKFVRRHRTGVAFAAVLMLLLAGFATTMAVQAGRIAAERDRANVEAERANSEAGRATQEAQAAQEVTEFLVGLFQVSDPGEARGSTITAREILDRGAESIQHELRDQPPLRARMMDTMGRVYQNLGLYTKAESLLVSALDLRQTELGEEHLDSVESLSHLGWLQFWQGRLDEARSTHEKVLAVRQHELGDEHVDTAWSLYHLGVTNVFRGELLRGRSLLERALPIFEKELGADHQAVAWCLNDIGLSYQDMEDNASALPYFERALKVKEKALGPDHHDVAGAYMNVGLTLMRLGRLPEAQQHLETAVKTTEKSLGPNHVELAPKLNNLGDLLRVQGDYVGSRAYMNRALQIYESTVGSAHWGFPWIIHDLALLARDTKKYAEADSLFRRALENWEQNLGADHPHVVMTLENHAAVLREMGRSEEAATMEERAKAIRKRKEAASDSN